MAPRPHRVRHRVLLAAAVASLLVAGCTGSAPVGGDPSDPRPTISGWDELDDPTSPTPSASPSPEATPTPTTPRPEPTEPSPEAPCPTGTPIRDGRMYGGGLSIPVPDGWQYDLWRTFDWIGCPAILDLRVVDTWYADLKLGEAMTSRPSLQMLAEDVSAVATLDLFPRDVVGVRQVHSRSATVDGRKAWWVRREIRVELDNPVITGDRLDIVVVDVGQGRQGIFVGVAPLWDKGLQRVVDQSRTALRVE